MPRADRSRRNVSRIAATAANGHFCDAPGCNEPGAYRAPVSPQRSATYYWFCLDHVREYNKAWNYFEGMNEAEIEAFRRLDVIGHRPSWPFGTHARAHRHFDPRRMHDGFGPFFGDDEAAANGGGAHPPGAVNGNPVMRKALSVLDLDPPPTLERIKARYKELVKRHHPDANGGDMRSEERIKAINQAYAILIENLSTRLEA
jgi:hypothetical protein